MANLSNINNKFLVTTTGEVLVGRTAATGTSKLQVSGSLLIGTDISSGIPLVVQETTADGFAIGFMRNTNATNGNGLVIDVNSTGGAYIQDWRQASTVKMRLLQNGNLGIGTDSPGSRKLSVVKDTGITAGFNDIAEFLDTTLGGGGSVSLNIGRANSSKNLGKMAFKYVSSGSNSNTLNFGFYDADNLMTIQAGGNVGIGTDDPQSKLEVATSNNINDISDGAIQVVSSSPIAFVAPSNLNPSLNRWGFTLREGGEGHFGIRDYRNSSNRVTIDDAGKVGIGVTSPSQKLQVDGGATGLNQGIPATSGTTQNGILRLTSGDAVYGETFDFGMNVGPTYAWIQSTNKDGLNTNYSLALNPNGGNVGIGTTTPSYKLEVSSKTRLYNVAIGGTDGGLYNVYSDSVVGINNLHLAAQGSGAVYVNSALARPMYINPLGGDVGIGTLTPRARLEVVGDTTIQNGVYTYQTGGYTSGATAINVDITVGNEGGGGNVFKIEAGFAHYYAMTYNSLAEWWCTSRGTAVVNTYILNAGTTAAGDWSASKPNATTLRVTKSAGTYGGGGKWWFKVTYIPF